MKAEVLRLGTYPVGGVAAEDLPILTVRLHDGSIREVQAAWADVDDCKPGRSISLLQHESALQVGQRGCALSLCLLSICGRHFGCKRFLEVLPRSWMLPSVRPVMQR